MKITVEVADSLLQEARARAESQGVPLRHLIEEGLRAIVQRTAKRKPFRLRDGSFGGSGLVENLSWNEIRRRVYAGRGERDE